MTEDIADYVFRLVRERNAMLERLAYASLADVRRPGIRHDVYGDREEFRLDPEVPFLTIHEHQHPIQIDLLTEGNDMVYRFEWVK